MLIGHLTPVKSMAATAIVSIRGSIDPKNLSSLATALETGRGRGFCTLVFDLGEIRYINSAGLAYLVNLSDLLADRGGGLYLANAQPKVKLIFELMGLTEMFRIFRTVDTALSAAAAGRPTSPPVPSRVSRRG